MTEGGTEFSEATKTKITTSVDSILRGQILTEGTRKRKRRNTEGGDEGAADGKTPEQVNFQIIIDAGVKISLKKCTTPQTFNDL